MTQCSGTTKQNQRCKINVAQGRYCHYHKNQESKLSSFLNGSSKPSQHFTTVTTTATATSSTAWASSSSSSSSTNKIKPSVPTYKIQLSASPENPTHKHNHKYQPVDNGSIYIYTLSHLLTKKPQLKDWLKIQVPNHKRNVNWEPFNPKNFLLIKVGLTTQHVSKRINQWLKQCNHEITLIEPFILHDNTPSTLSGLFKSLSLNEPYSSSPSSLTLPSSNSHGKHRLLIGVKNMLLNMNTKNKIRDCKLKTFNVRDNGFYCPCHLALIEKRIHAILRLQFGKVELQCENCTLASKQNTVHREWFLIPRDRLIDVFYLIDDICYKYSRNEKH